MKPAQNVLNASKIPMTGDASGKKSGPSTSAAAVPNMEKSYHSIELPISPAAINLRSHL